MKNILVLTSIYPSDESPRGFTPVVHYFAKEWVKRGYNVKVIHNQTKFFKLLYYIPDCFRRKFESKLGFALPVLKLTKEKQYEKDGVIVHRFPIFRLFPFFPFHQNSIKNQIHKISRLIEHENFRPDYILAHWTMPQLPIVLALKKLQKCKTAIVFHSMDNIHLLTKETLEEFDSIGFRSLKIRNMYFDRFGQLSNYFMCYSGIHETSIIPESTKIFSENISKFIFVGNLIERKFPDVVLRALATSYKDEDFSLKIIGDGPMRSTLTYEIKTQKVQEKVKLFGQIPREDVLLHLDNSDCFIMISQEETFGLVYIEAMAKGCIVIASKDEGMDGIIKHGKNGFLCDAGNEKQLLDLINLIKKLDENTIRNITNNAISTSQSLSEQKVALNYISQLAN
jgi:glycosyltransferase involved in cell wall biosynthesis